LIINHSKAIDNKKTLSTTFKQLKKHQVTPVLTPDSYNFFFMI